jgi:hypothetical protein
MRLFIIAFFMLCGIYAGINAAFLQDGRHPSPLARTAAPVKTGVMKYPPLPRPAPRQNNARTRAPANQALPPATPLDKAALAARLRKPGTTKSISPGSAPLDKTALTARLKQSGITKSINPRSTPLNSKATIRLVQIGLAELGYNPGPLDGALGEKTVNAIKQFEAHRSLPVTGRITKPLLKELRQVSGTSVLNVL